MSRNLDAASGIPITARARAALDAALARGWADPARLHHDGRVARQLLDAARTSIAGSLGALPQEVTFTGSGTGAIHAAVLGLARGRARVGRQVVVGAVEHSAVLRAADWVVGSEPVTIPVDSQAQVDVEDFADSVSEEGVALACLQHANHEVGTIQPLARAHAACAAAGVPLVVDACASLGTLSAPREWDVLVGSAHKWGGPAGVGILVVRTGVRWRSPTPTDESGRWAGFPDVPAVVAAAVALEEAGESMAQRARTRADLVARLRAEVPRLADDVLVLGPDEGRLPHLTCFTVLYADGETLVTELDRLGYAVTSGSACTADTRRPSHVLAAMGAITHGNLRVSLAPEITADDIDGFLVALPRAIDLARAAGDRAAGDRAAGDRASGP